MRNYEPNLLVWYGRADLKDLIRRYRKKSDRPFGLLKIAKMTFFCTIKNSRHYEDFLTKEK